MNVFAIHSSWGRGGNTINLGFIVKTLVEKEHTVIVLNRHKDESSLFLERCGAQTININFPLKMNTTAILEDADLSLFMIIKQNLKELLRIIVGFFLTCYYLCKFKPDILFLADVVFPQCAIAGFMLGVTTVCNIQAEIIHGRWGLRRNLLIRIINKCDKIFGITRFHIKPFLKKSLNSEKFAVIPNTVNIQENDESNYNTGNECLPLDIPVGKKIISYFGGASEIKGYKLLLEIINNLVSKRSDIIFIFAGAYHRDYSTKWSIGTEPGELSLRETKNLFHLINKYELNDHIMVVGVRCDVIPIMRKSDVIIVPNRLPHFSRPIIEGFFSKTPVLGTNDVFNRDVIQDGVNGLLAIYGQVPIWVKKIEQLLDNAPLAKTITQNAYVFFQKNYNPVVTTSKIAATFETIGNQELKA